MVRRLAWRRVEQRFRGSVLGVVWALVHPLLLLAVYTFVFSIVFKARWGAPGAGTAEFSLFLYSGILVYALFAECVNEAPTLMLQNSSFVKQHRFPLEVLPWVSVTAALFNFSIGFIVLSAFYATILGAPPVSVAWSPLIVLPVVLGTLGVAWILAALGVFLRDIAQVIGVLTTALLFLSPIFYPASRIGEEWRQYYFLNPFVQILEMWRDALFHGVPPDGPVLGATWAGGWALAWVGFICFMRSKPTFADVV